MFALNHNYSCADRASDSASPVSHSTGRKLLLGLGAAAALLLGGCVVDPGLSYVGDGGYYASGPYYGGYYGGYAPYGTTIAFGGHRHHGGLGRRPLPRRRSWRPLAGRRASSLRFPQHLLEDVDIQQPAELEADLLERADVDEAGLFVEVEALIAAGGDSAMSVW